MDGANVREVADAVERPRVELESCPKKRGAVLVADDGRRQCPQGRHRAGEVGPEAGEQLPVAVGLTARTRERQRCAVKLDDDAHRPRRRRLAKLDDRRGGLDRGRRVGYCSQEHGDQTGNGPGAHRCARLCDPMRDAVRRRFEL